MISDTIGAVSVAGSGMPLLYQRSGSMSSKSLQPFDTASLTAENKIALPSKNLS